MNSLYAFAAISGLLLPLALGITEEEKDMFSNRVTIVDSGDTYIFTSNSTPDHATGDFPNPDNPNVIIPQTLNFTVLKSPGFADEESCMPLGSIGMAVNGVPLFNPYTLEMTDAVINEVFDDCDGHPAPDGQYHYHQTPSCVYSGGNNELVGIAIDGFPVYGSKDENGVELTSADLDMCHGRMYNGQYQYHMTKDFPYILGCFKGPVELSSKQLERCEMAIADDHSAANPVHPTSLTTVLGSVVLITFGALM